MKWEDAEKVLKKGGRVVRASWGCKESYLYRCIGLYRSGNPELYKLSDEDKKATDWIIFKQLKDRVIKMKVMSLEFPNDGRKRCELESNSSVICEKILSNCQQYTTEPLYLSFIERKDVKKDLKKFIEFLEAREKSIAVDRHTSIRRGAKEIFGEEFIK